MTVQDFIRKYEGCNTLTVDLFDLNTEETVELTTEDLYYLNEDNAEWKNASIEGWSITNRYTICISVIKE